MRAKSAALRNPLAWRVLCYALDEMPISGLVLTTHHPAPAEVLEALSEISGVTVGVPVGRKLPVVTEASTLTAARKLTERLMQVAGVAFVDVVSVDFQDEEL